MNPRLRRLQADYESIRERFSGHPNIVVEPLGTVRPPDMYRVTYLVRGLVATEAGEPELRESHVVDIQLPLRYPFDKPVARPEERIFHPNIGDFFCTADHWTPDTTICDLILQMGDMIQWRDYNIGSPLDTVAADWAIANEKSKSVDLPVGDVELGSAPIEFEIETTIEIGETPKPS